MTNQECANCGFFIEGSCRLKYVLGCKQPQCPYKEGNAAMLV